MRISDWSSDVCSSDLVNIGSDKEADLGPLVSPNAKKRVESLIQQGVDEGAELVLDGRNLSVPGYESGNFVGPTVFNGVKANMAIYHEEIFGPVLCVVGVDTLEEAVERSEEHTSELQSLMRTSYAVFCLKKKTNT